MIKPKLGEWKAVNFKNDTSMIGGKLIYQTQLIKTNLFTA